MSLLFLQTISNVELNLSLGDLLGIIVAALAAIISGILVYITFRFNKEQKSFQELQKKSLYTDTFKNIAAAQRSLFSDIYSNQLFYKAYRNDKGYKKPEDIVGTFLANHAYMLYYYNEHGLIEESEWNFFKKDIKGFFQIECVINRWPHTGRLYSNEFRKFLEELGLNLPQILTEEQIAEMEKVAAADVLDDEIEKTDCSSSCPLKIVLDRFID